ncbi:MAG TPA: dienelactone hydrolase family protein [Casimicrobiaceae bacterium]
MFAFALAPDLGARSLTRVSFSSLDRDEHGAPVQIQAMLLLPDGPMPDGGYPAIVALHGCSGMYSIAKGREDHLADRLAVRADLLLSDGYAVLFPDSFRSRGRNEVCTIKIGENPIMPMRRRLDALGALAFLAERPDIARDRVALVGWSHGGSTALATINVRDREVAAFRDKAGAPPFFRAAVAFYPGCAVSLRAGDRWQPGVPTRIHLGESDDWTPAKPCVDLGEAMIARGEPLKVVVYPNAHHGFDAPDGAVVHRTDVPNGTNPGQGVHVGANPAAREKANAKVRAFLNGRLRGPDDKAH